MATWPLSPVSPPLGLPADKETLRLMNRTGAPLTIGMVVQLDLHSVATETTNYQVGDDNSVFANAILVSAGTNTVGLSVGWFALVEEAAADNFSFRCRVRGKGKALVKGTNAAALTDYLLVLDGDEELDSDAVAADTLQKVVGIPLEVTAGATAELIDVLFNGVEGLGYVFTVTPNPP